MVRDIVAYNPDENMLVNLTTNARIYIYKPQGSVEHRLYHKTGGCKDSQVIARGTRAQMQKRLTAIVDAMKVSCNIVDIGFIATNTEEGAPNEK